MKSEIETKTFRVFRGGSWVYYAGFARVAYRIRCAPRYRNYNLGFRLARTVKVNKQVERWREELEEGLFNGK